MYRRKRSGYLVRVRSEARDFTQFLFKMSKKCSNVARQSNNNNRFGSQNHMGYDQQFVSEIPNKYNGFFDPEGQPFSGLQNTCHANNILHPSQTVAAGQHVGMSQQYQHPFPRYNINQFGVGRSPTTLPGTGSSASHPLSSVNTSGAEERNNILSGGSVVLSITAPVATTSSMPVTTYTTGNTGSPVTWTSNALGSISAASPFLNTTATSLHNGASINRVATTPLTSPYSYPSPWMFPNNYSHGIALRFNQRSMQSYNYKPHYTSGSIQQPRLTPPSGSNHLFSTTFGLNNQCQNTSAGNFFNNTPCEYALSPNKDLLSTVAATTASTLSFPNTGISTSTTANNTKTDNIIVTSTTAQTINTATTTA